MDRKWTQVIWFPTGITNFTKIYFLNLTYFLFQVPRSRVLAVEHLWLFVEESHSIPLLQRTNLVTWRSIVNPNTTSWRLVWLARVRVPPAGPSVAPHHHDASTPSCSLNWTPHHPRNLPSNALCFQAVSRVCRVPWHPTKWCHHLWARPRWQWHPPKL